MPTATVRACLLLIAATLLPVPGAWAEDELEYVDIETLLAEEPAAASEDGSAKREAKALEEFADIETLLRDTGDAAAVRAAESGAASGQTIGQELKALREQVIQVNRDLGDMERELLYPVSSQVNVFVSLDAGELFTPDSIALKVNDRLVASHLYTEREVKALQKGGIQRLFTGNVRKGDHELIAVINGKGARGEDLRRAASLMFDKDEAARYIELKITGDRERQTPDVQFREWE